MNHEIKKELPRLFIMAAIIVYLAYPPQYGISLIFGKAIIWVFLIWSLLSIAVKSVKYLYMVKTGKNYETSSLLTPSVIAVFSLVGILYLNSINNRAIEYLWDVATSVNNLCQLNGRCPISPEGWEEFKYDSRYYYLLDQGNTKFHLFYSGNLESFNIYIKYGLDLAYRLHGGVGKRISIGMHAQP